MVTTGSFTIPMMKRLGFRDYEAAAAEMIERTGSSCAPWHPVAANSKRHARIEVFKILCRALDRALS